ncbi:hypothetical protein QKT49_gp010 [Acanthamoeba castellanii medusavirus]|uniref:Uncharacterized protein n=1 Tax=Acanthamoeba castellanii medusavirus J1 TaxID=3114988 RepID=A0A3T1CWD0_9VIRU|nr:hypothetical protein QKT49_gp010 [Acanthamoeba castellanii medusavirus]BBI30150.1 hypothetical protein [Acanthamoeba castellanii medusavirus J1]
MQTTVSEEERCRPRPIPTRPTTLVTRVRHALFGENPDEQRWRRRKELEEWQRVEDCKWALRLQRE